MSSDLESLDDAKGAEGSPSPTFLARHLVLHGLLAPPKKAYPLSFAVFLSCSKDCQSQGSIRHLKKKKKNVDRNGET